MKSLRNATAAFALMLVLTACSTLGVPSPQSFNERLASGYTTVTTAAQTTQALMTAEKLSKADAANIEKQLTVAKEGIDVARTLQGTLPVAAEDRLTASIKILSAIQLYLDKRGVK